MFTHGRWVTNRTPQHVLVDERPDHGRKFPVKDCLASHTALQSLFKFFWSDTGRPSEDVSRLRLEQARYQEWIPRAENSSAGLDLL